MQPILYGKRRTIKSYVLRAGRLSNRQKNALDKWLTDYSITRSDFVWDLAAEFGRDTETIAEIGFGMGSSLLTMAKACPFLNFIGIELHQAGIGSLVADLHEHRINNVRIAPYDAVGVFETCLPEDSLMGVQIFFPDPWPKKRHQKRRLIQGDFIHLLVNRIKIGGFIHCATDWQDYAEHMLTTLSSEPALRNQQPNGGFTPRPDTRPLTKFEQRGLRLGHEVWDLIFVRIK